MRFGLEIWALFENLLLRLLISSHLWAWMEVFVENGELCNRGSHQVLNFCTTVIWVQIKSNSISLKIYLDLKAFKFRWIEVKKRSGLGEEGCFLVVDKYISVFVGEKHVWKLLHDKQIPVSSLFITVPC